MTGTRRSHTGIFAASDILSVYASIALAFYTRVWLGGFVELIPLSHGMGSYLARWWIPLTVVVMITYHRGYGILITYWDESFHILKSLFMSFLVAWVILSLQKETEEVSRIVVTLSFIYMAFIMTSVRALVRFLLYRIADFRREAFIHAGEDRHVENALMSFLDDEWYAGYRITGRGGPSVAGDHAAVCFISVESADEKTIRQLKPNFKDLIIVSDATGLSFMNTEIKTYINKSLALIATTNGLLSRNRLFLKRAFDITISCLGLMLSVPIFAVVAAMIKIDSRGPVFFRHKRCGKGLSEFEMIKFRTMHINSEETLKRYLEKNPESLRDLEEKNKIEEDPRVTRIGKLLRRTSVDELPQLFNVLAGAMSIVGPRPDSREAVEKFYQEYKEIYENIRPGITGLWQVSGRSDVDYKRRVKLDYLYMLNWSLWLDSVILLSTFRAILSGKGAY
ncbi:MAG TPA: sugar transferase [Syntrophorhabdaceae bacterium]|nr:sugar transferase [Syntrophorhabdaceae bacterium]HNT67918.1 sugar transferase [Syntrophorhabdaceae bacterium]